MLKRIILLFSLLAFASFSFAHDPGLSSAELTVTEQGVAAKITFSVQDVEALVPMDSDQDAEVTPAEQAAAKPKIAQWLTQGVQFLIDGQAVQPASVATVSFDEQNNAQISLQFSQTPQSTVQYNANYLSKLPTGHKQFLSIKNSAGHSLGEKMLSQQDSGFSYTVGETDELAKLHNAPSFTGFLVLGIEHILTGYDHLLFLFSLLVVTRHFLPAFKIITFFTIAHSITLGLAAFNIIDIPSSIVEPLIAATIIYVGVENLLRGDKVTGRQWLTFFFGLVHGFGFAAVLREMGISSLETGILVPLFSFNLGVELGQIAVASIVLPIIWWLHKKPTVEPYMTPVCSSLATLAGAWWLLERTVLS